MTSESLHEGEAVTTSSTGSTKLRSIPGLDPEIVEKLNSIGIVDNGTLLARGAQPEGRDAICAATGIDAVRLLSTLYLIDLERVEGVSWTSARLLVAAGVTTVPDLAFRSAEDLLPQIQRANEELGLMKRLPSRKIVQSWIDHARTLPQAIFFGGNSEVF